MGMESTDEAESLVWMLMLLFSRCRGSRWRGTSQHRRRSAFVAERERDTEGPGELAALAETVLEVGHHSSGQRLSAGLPSTGGLVGGLEHRGGMQHS